MTREEAIEILEKYKTESEEDYYVKRAEALDMAIKTLEQKPCEDAVSRKEVKEAIMKCETISEDSMDGYIDSTTKLEVEIDCIPSVTPTQRWIPVSERLPEESITVIGTTKLDDIYKTELYDDCGEKKWYANGDFDVPIVAWMPLPKPYKAEMESEDGILDKSTQ